MGQMLKIFLIFCNEKQFCLKGNVLKFVYETSKLTKSFCKIIFFTFISKDLLV